jgi:hypothetical protein
MAEVQATGLVSESLCTLIHPIVLFELWVCDSVVTIYRTKNRGFYAKPKRNRGFSAHQRTVYIHCHIVKLKILFVFFGKRIVFCCTCTCILLVISNKFIKNYSSIVLF